MELLEQLRQYLQDSFGLVAPLWGVTGLALGIALMLVLSALRERRLKAREQEIEGALAAMVRERTASDERARQLTRREERLQQMERSLRSQADVFQAQVEQVRGWLDQVAPPPSAGQGSSSARMQPSDRV
jgi:small-conductance mechanosensitive channel